MAPEDFARTILHDPRVHTTGEAVGVAARGAHDPVGAPPQEGI